MRLSLALLAATSTLVVQHMQCYISCVGYHVAHRVDLHAQRDVSEADAKLTTAARTVFASSAPSFWYLLAMLLPKPLIPFIRWLAAKFPDESLSALHKAYEVIYDASAFLIEVSLCLSHHTHTRTNKCMYCAVQGYADRCNIVCRCA